MLKDQTTQPPSNKLNDACRNALVQAALDRMIIVAAELGVSADDLHAMLSLGMAPAEIIEYLHTKLHNRIQ